MSLTLETHKISAKVLIEIEYVIVAKILIS